MVRQTDHAMLRSLVTGEREMDDSEADRASIMAVIRAETEAWLQRDFEALASHWMQSPQTRRMEAFASLGVRVDEGWDPIAARIKKIVERFPEKHAFEGRVRWEKVNIVVDANMAWVTFDQIGSDTGEDRKRQLRILHRIGGAWKIGCMVMMESSVEEARCSLIEVDADAKILWTNRLARERIRGHPGLVAAAGRLRARRRDRDVALREAVRLAFHELQSQRPLNIAPKQAWSVALGEDAAGIPLYCWVLLEDGKALVSFDDAETVVRRIASAREVFGLSPAQTRLARLIVDGHDLAAASDQLGVSVNTLRTQLQRIFDKTGVRSQAALVRALLSAGTPSK
ncbi:MULTISPECIES: helix-turn-helix transcriptional regulator [unclassified Rhizobium]|uniref:helix-turn-helix domain-containing protein n=1 Tax=unclassified Rhizobium TaxID=2613769 RepID=UPI001A98BDEC|nr:MULTISPECIES: helix-turn-helix transcriptional regulator [unclassified Rhizobium]MBX5166611.1 helix-turn-helix transcriptional regulator [Rhizobium sp. NZLR4b]MBX5171375.1 helix-turn-helix transcriptional regulator [Rhizobium sp. NZLR1b]MBX5182384.1 helix-turn-helix transcriptional regulator [Rhizobium sp. NZLR5]MBX5190194.1 helix-turn-helix transcriptional regulator [Rhizobium sp. NZLR3b]MBX5194495.1 helix-turn-helix transcriptional regulator [Rhizobium sp. NZLR10]